jgi:hypothetical protein
MPYSIVHTMYSETLSIEDTSTVAVSDVNARFCTDHLSTETAVACMTPEWSFMDRFSLLGINAITCLYMYSFICKYIIQREVLLHPLL